MNRELIQGLLKAIDEKKVYDWLSDNYWKLSKDELATISKELAYALEGGDLEDLKDTLLMDLEECEED